MKWREIMASLLEIDTNFVETVGKICLHIRVHHIARALLVAFDVCVCLFTFIWRVSTTFSAGG